MEYMWGNFLIDYSSFLLKTVTILIAVLILMAYSMKNKLKKKNDSGKVEITDLTEKLLEQKEKLEIEILGEKEYKKLEKKREAEEKAEETVDPKRLYVIEFEGNINADEVNALREEITAILTIANEGDEVLLKLESPGGSVHGYGLGASQLKRLKDKNIKLTVAVDKVAASGGYLMACVGDEVASAPFAVLGSIGVVAEVPNIHRLLKKHDIDVDVMTAGEYKRTVTLLGENTEEAKDKFKEQLQDIHKLFKDFVKENRPKLDLDKVATGEAWYGTQALDLDLIDKIKTSDDIILEAIDEKDVYLVKYEEKKSIVQKIGLQVENSLFAVVAKVLDKNTWIR